MVAANSKPLVGQVRSVDAKALKGDLIQPGHPLFGIVWINKNRHSGEPCFFGTRVPIFSLFNVLKAGDGIPQFLDDFRGVSNEQALAILDLARGGLLAKLLKP